MVLRWCWKCKRNTMHTDWGVCIVCVPRTTRVNPQDLPLVVVGANDRRYKYKRRIK